MNGKGKILLVDDDPDIGNILKMMLEYTGYQVKLLSQANNIEDALRQHRVDLIVLDMLIAGISGTEVCKRLKNHPDFADVPVIMITALPNAREVCIKAGANDFISKPFEMTEVLAKVNHLIGKKTV